MIRPKELIAAVLLLTLLAFTYSSPGDNGFVAGESVSEIHMNEIDTALDGVQNGSGITALDVDLITGDTSDDDDLDVAAGGTGVSTLTDGGVLVGNGASDLVALTAGTNGQILIGQTGADPAFTTIGTDATVSAAGALTISANAVALSTDTTGNYVATIADSGASEVTVSGSGSEGAAVTLALASTMTRDSELKAFTIGTAAPTDGSDACVEGDMWLDHTANKIYWCVDNATDDWFGVALTDTP